MKHLVQNEKSGTIIGVYRTESRTEALDLMAQDAGYDSYEQCLHTLQEAGFIDPGIRVSAI